MKRPEQDYAPRALRTIGWVVLWLVVLSLIPPITVGGIKLRRANIFAELYAFDDAHAEAQEPTNSLFDEVEFAVDLEEVSRQIEQIEEPSHTLQRQFEWVIEGYASPSRAAIEVDTRRYIPKLTPIEDFSSEDRFAAFCDTLLRADRTVRIAVLGDSFIEGDILTADLRERLQAAFGGRGTGFAPMASPLTNFRRSIKTQSKGWTSYNVMQQRKTPAPYNEQFFVSGWVCRPETGASTRWECTNFREGVESCSTARIHLIAPRDSRIELTLNDTLRHTLAIEGGAMLREIAVRAPQIRSLEFKVAEGASELIGYGASFEDQGVTVDNYSVRSNNGQAIFRTNPSLNAQLNALAPYDLVILQYGLNIMQQGVLQYTSYGEQIEKMIAYVRQCFPAAAVLVMGVSDRAVKSEKGVETMDAIPYMIDCQRTAAKNQGAAFWSTFDAMQAQGGIEEFVAHGWAGKDFTHINYGGGRRVAWALFDAINHEADKSAKRHQRRLEREQALIDSLAAIAIRAQLMQAPSLDATPQF
ncbi:MAG: hypothetical protein IKZ12_05125 [Alistipes sp.]|nr:hypothetical protein [Alistipes sp.]